MLSVIPRTVAALYQLCFPHRNSADIVQVSHSAPAVDHRAKSRQVPSVEGAQDFWKPCSRRNWRWSETSTSGTKLANPVPPGSCLEFRDVGQAQYPPVRVLAIAVAESPVRALRRSLRRKRINQKSVCVFSMKRYSLKKEGPRFVVTCVTGLKYCREGILRYRLVVANEPAVCRPDGDACEELFEGYPPDLGRKVEELGAACHFGRKAQSCWIQKPKLLSNAWKPLRHAVQEQYDVGKVKPSINQRKKRRLQIAGGRLAGTAMKIIESENYREQWGFKVFARPRSKRLLVSESEVPTKVIRLFQQRTVDFDLVFRSRQSILCPDQINLLVRPIFTHNL